MAEQITNRVPLSNINANLRAAACAEFEAIEKEMTEQETHLQQYSQAGQPKRKWSEIDQAERTTLNGYDYQRLISVDDFDEIEAAIRLKHKKRDDEARKRRQARRKNSPKNVVNTSELRSPPKPGDHPDLAAIQLPDEATDDVQIFDTCNEIRSKITSYLQRNGVTQASFLRDLRQQYHTEKAPVEIQQAQLRRFRSYTEPLQGAMGGLYYAAYVFFEKLRLKEGGEKSEHRVRMEEEWPVGVDTSRSANQGGITFFGPVEPVQDEFGKWRRQPLPRGELPAGGDDWR